MRKSIIALCIMAACLLAGCHGQSSAIGLDTLTLEIPAGYTAVKTKNTGAQQIFQNQQNYICTYKESKQQLMDALQKNGVTCDFISLESYVQSYSENNELEAHQATEIDTWYLKGTVTVGDTQYEFTCVFYETEENFWRVYGCCPQQLSDANSQDLWEIITAFQ